MLAAYEAGLAREVDRIADAIPHERLAVQWDVASAVFERLERGEPNAYGATRDEMMQTFVRWHLNIGRAVPKDVHLMYHLCYGDADHKHSIEPASTAFLVAFANRVSAEIGRTIELIHMPVPRSRSDDAYFAPLADLRLRPETKLALGLVHYTDGVEGTRQRIAAARKYVDDFAIATECGFGRRPPEAVERLMRIHVEVARSGCR
jgi:methionine synthase II (cobalamin-independent)